jgi:hypothetical protein
VADIGSPKARERVHLALYWRLRLLRSAAIALVPDDIEARFGVRNMERETTELRAFPSSEGIDIGAAYAHPPASLFRGLRSNGGK